MGDIRIGTSGWSYPSGPGAWKGLFCPAGAEAGRGRPLDGLSYYAEHFDTVEVNSSFYRIPDPGTARKWAERTPSRFDFSLKLYQKFTHPGMYKRAQAPGMPPDEVSPIPAVTRADVDLFKAAIDPLAAAGKVGALLAQFPPGFRASGDAEEYLAWLLRAFSGYPLAVELRHRSWSDRMGETLALLNAHGAAWAQIDEPKFRFSVRQDLLPNLRTLYYMRLHGRNAEKWWAHDHPDERYNYLYSPGEIDAFADTVNAVRRLVHRIYVYMNNHFAAKAVANAAALRHKMGQPVPGEYSDRMLECYPFMQPFVRRAGCQSLFLTYEREEPEAAADGSGRGEGPAEDAEPQEG